MSISISWRIARPVKGATLPATAANLAVYEEVFGSKYLSHSDIRVLVAMHRATGLNISLWGAPADAIHRLPQEAEVEVTAEY